MLLFFDTETTGKWIKGVPVGDPRQPKIVQLAALLTEDDGREVMSLNAVVYQEVEVPAEAVAIHGKSSELIQRIGVNEGTALTLFEEMLAAADTVIAHNGEFDQMVVTNAIQIIDKQPSDPFAGKRAFCTMRASTNVCKLPGQKGYKWPTLTEAHTFLLGEAFDGAHDAMADVRACKNIYFALMDILAAHQQAA